MKNPILIIFIAMLTMIISRSVYPEVFPYKYYVDKLENGLTVVTIPMESEGLVAYYSIVRTGSRDEWEPGHSGFAHLFEHMMFRGTKRYPGNVYDKILTQIGADANAYTTDDFTCYHLKFSNKYLKKVIDLESDRFKNLSYTENVFKTETGAVYGEYLKGRMNPWFLLEEKLHSLAFEKHTYKHTTIGFEEDIKAMPGMYEFSLSFFNRYYRPENVVIVIAGDVKRDMVIKLIKKYYRGWESGYVPPKIETEPEQREEKYGEVKYKGKTLPILAIAYKGDSFKSDDKRYVASLVIEELAFGENSDLYKTLFLKEQKVEFIYPDFGINRDPSLFTVYTMIKSEDDIEYVKSAIISAVEKLKINVLDKQKIEDVKNHIKYSFLQSLDSPDHVAGRLARFIAITGGVDCIDRMFNTLEKIEPEDIKEAAEYYFDSAKRTIVLLKGE
ncbi:MAG: insulinase family protein [Candidatus Marinimicrobia bacterium]|nr:insulinase family protein [Candidatus Neomarinimicrobiota bacterium]